MKLSEKGPFAPPPRLRGHGQAVAESVACWEGVHARTHWLLGDATKIDGVDFYVGDDELGHIHLDSEAHVFHARPVAEALFARGLSEPFAWNRSVGVFEISSAADVAQALWLFQLSYDRLRGAKTSDLVALVSAAVSERFGRVTA